MLLSILALTLSYAQGKGPISSFVDRATGATPRGLQAGYGLRKGQTRFRGEGMKLSDSRLDLGLPAGDRWMFLPQARIKEIHTQARIPGTDRTVPSTLWDTRMTMDYRISAGGGAGGVGVSLTGGSASDRPFNGVGESFYDATFFMSFAPEPRSHLLAFVDFSDLRPVFRNIPIPGFSYGLRLSPRWGVRLGFPSAGAWAEPFDWLLAEASVEPLAHVDARLAARLNTVFSLYAGFQIEQEMYRRAGRVNVDESLVLTDATASLGIEQKLRFLLLRLGAGFAIDRSIVETDNYLRDRPKNLVSSGNGWLAELNTRVAF